VTSSIDCEPPRVGRRAHPLSLKIAQDGRLTQVSTWVSVILGL